MNRKRDFGFLAVQLNNQFHKRRADSVIGFHAFILKYRVLKES